MSIENTITNIQGINACGCHYDTDSQLGWRSFVLLICSAFCCFSLNKTWNRKQKNNGPWPWVRWCFSGTQCLLIYVVNTFSNISEYGWVWFEELSRSIRVSFGLALEHVTVQDMLNSPFHIISYHAIPYHTISYHIISYHIISYHIISYIISYHIISYHIISYHIISYIISYQSYG